MDEVAHSRKPEKGGAIRSQKLHKLSDAAHQRRFTLSAMVRHFPLPGERDAAHALRRLEASEEEAYRPLQIALNVAISFRFKRRRSFGCGALRDSGAILFCAEWMRIAFMQFLSSEGKALMGIKDFGEWKYYVVERFRGILNLTVLSADKTKSAIPDWAKKRIREAWNVTET